MMTMSETQSNTKNIFTSLFFIVILLVMDLFTLSLQPQAKAISHLSVGVLFAQMVVFLVFSQGQICNGQRSRLIKVNLYLLLYWSIWLFISLFSNYHYVITDLVSLCGIAGCLAAWFQPQDPQMRKSILILGALLSGLGIICYFLMFMDLSWHFFPQYNLFAQLLMGVILANILLVISRNRLHGFIALLPLVMLIFLLLNAMAVLGFMAYAYSSAVTFANEFALGLYFLLHLVIVAIIALHIFRKWTLSYNTLMILLLLTASLPLWVSFAYIA